MKILSIGLLSSVIGIACAGTGKQAAGLEKEQSLLDTSKYTIIMSGNSNHTGSGKKTTTLSANEIEELDSLFQKAILDHNSVVRDPFRYIKDLSVYKRQYVPVINEKGEKEVWVNCFCSKHPNWKTEIGIVTDGGSCYFNLIINLHTKMNTSLDINGTG